MEGKPNDLVERIKAHSFFASIHAILDDLLNPDTFIGSAPHQVVFVLIYRFTIAGIIFLSCINSGHKIIEFFFLQIFNFLFL
jgi:hypothetical protein